MTVEQFDNGYYYAADLKVFAREIGIAIGDFRKFEFEELIREFLRTGKAQTVNPLCRARSPIAEGHRTTPGVREDADRKMRLMQASYRFSYSYKFSH